MMLVGTHGHGLGWLSLLSDFKYPVLSNSTLYYNLVRGLGPAPPTISYGVAEIMEVRANNICSE